MKEEFLSVTVHTTKTTIITTIITIMAIMIIIMIAMTIILNNGGGDDFSTRHTQERHLMLLQPKSPRQIQTP
jgi:hypothetical protein